jgi:predicted Zn-dependent protease
MGLFGGYDGYGYRRGGIRLTWIIAAIIAVIGLVRYFGSGQKNPVTGEVQRVALSPEQEVALGMRTAPQMAREMGGDIPASDPRTQLVRQVGDRLARQIGSTPWRFQFHLINSPQTVNAFALPGGQVFITTALFNQLTSEAQLAGVLGHEIGHVIHRHSAQQMAKQQLGQSIVQAVGVGASGDGNGYTAAQMAAVAEHYIQLSYSRENELESDTYGVTWMVKAGYDPNEMIQVMEVLKRASGGGGRQPEFSSTHPDPGNRAEQIRAQIKRNFPNGLPPGLTKGQPLRSLPGGRAGDRW